MGFSGSLNKKTEHHLAIIIYPNNTHLIHQILQEKTGFRKQRIGIFRGKTEMFECLKRQGFGIINKTLFSMMFSLLSYEGFKDVIFLQSCDFSAHKMWRKAVLIQMNFDKQEKKCAIYEDFLYPSKRAYTSFASPARLIGDCSL